MKKPLRVTLFGPQGCGKGTQGQLLADRFDIPLIGAGEMIRAEISEKTSLGRLVKTYVDGGVLAPDELVNAIVAHRLKQMDNPRGFILDGYPRNVEQATYLDRMAKITMAIQVKISDTEALRRLVGRLQCHSCRQVYHETDAPPVKPGICAVCGGKLYRRSDDTQEVIKQRLAAYHFMTEPIAAYYRQRGVLLVVNGEQSIPYVFEDILKKLTKLGFTG